MRKALLIVISLVIVSCFCRQSSFAQDIRVEEREAEWNQIALPQSTFVRQTDAGKIVLFDIPGDWKLQPQQQTDRLSYVGPHNASVTVFVEKVADGIPLRDYVSAILRPLRASPSLADTLVNRRTSMSGLEAREITFISEDGIGELDRRTIWSVVNGPTAISVVFIVPVTNADEFEPFLKAIVQSFTLIDGANYKAFDELRSTYIKESKPFRIDEVQSLTASLAALDPSNRKPNINRLAEIFASTPDIAIDLTLDGRPMVRAAAYEAIAQSENNTLNRFLLRALDDRESFVAEKAAISIGANPRALELTRECSNTWAKFEAMARVWPFLNRGDQLKILEEVFAQPLLPAAPIAGKWTATVKTTAAPQGPTPRPDTGEYSQPTSDVRRHLNALTLLRNLPIADAKMPLSKLLDAKNDPLTILALQVSWERDEVLPANEMVKLLASDDFQIRRLASLHLGQSGTSANIAAIEAAFPKSGGATEASKPDETSARLSNELVSVDRIRFREKLATVSGEAKQKLVKDGLNDPKIADWVWYRYVKGDLSATSPVSGDLKVLPLGQNIFPRDVTYYAALPKPRDAVEKLGSAFGSLQLDSARSQASLVLLLSALREQLAEKLDAAPGAPVLSYSGINTNEPIALAHWFADGAPVGIPSAERRAIILRVNDRARFERSLSLYQQSIGNFKGLTDYLSGGFRMLTILPMFLPLSAKALLEGAITRPKEPPLLKAGFIGGTSWAGHSIKIIEQRTVDKNGFMTKDAAYLTYVGDDAILAPTLESLIDVLTRDSSPNPTLAANPGFKRILENPAEAIYLSNISQVIADPSGKNSSDKVLVGESGSLKISNSIWENAYRIQFPESDWLKPIIKFQPEQLKSPGELLPPSTIAYAFMKFDAAAAWREWVPQLWGTEERKVFGSMWTPDFEKEVLPELGPECGVAVLGLPSSPSQNWEMPWIAFFKLKSDKLEKAITAGQLINRASAESALATNKTQFKNMFTTVRNGYLVFANNEAALKALDQKDKLASARDYSRAARQAPADLVAFGGYNLEAAFDAVKDSGSDPVLTQKLMMLSALTSAFHSPNFYATASSDAVQGKFSLSMDREGRYSVSELSSLSKDYALTYAAIEAQGLPIQNQERLSSITIKIRASAAGEIERIREAVTSPNQIVEKITDQEMQLKVLPRQTEPKTKLTLPIKGNEFAVYLQPSNEIRSDDKTVIDQARKIAGEEHDAWQVARKLTEWTFTNIKWKRVDDATAPQTLATLEADCLEFSQLYVAMARSLGLPARIVSGLAHSGSAFGGHAWVEVYVGEWMEVDPTWGTNFVDATHIRNSASGALLTYASLNLVAIEILEAPRGTAEFQKNPRTLSEKLSQELAKGEVTALSSALDLAVLTNEKLGSGAWDSLTGAERSLMSAVYPRLLLELRTAFKKEPPIDDGTLRLLRVKETEGKAEALLLDSDGELFIKFVFTRRDEAWFLTEVLQTDTDLHVISETLFPTFQALQDRRANKTSHGHNNSDFLRTLLIMQRDPKASIAAADQSLQVDPTNQGLLHLKAMALSQTEKPEEAVQIWRNLAAAPKPFPPALLNLADYYEQLEGEANQKTAIEFFVRYVQLEPEDPRAHASLANLYEQTANDFHADSEYRTLVKLDPSNLNRTSFAAFLVRKDRINEGLSVIDEAGKTDAENDPFGELVSKLYWTDEKPRAERLTRSQPQRFTASALANLYVAFIRMENGAPLQAIPLLKRAATLKKDWPEPRITLSQAYRQLRNWPAALKTADAELAIDAESAEGYFERACALARMGRIKEALKSLEKAIALDEDMVDQISEEADLKVLANHPEFKKLIPPPEKQETKPR